MLSTLDNARGSALERILPLHAAIIDSLTSKQERGQTETSKQRRRITELEQRRRKAKAAYYADVLDLEEFKAEQEIIRRGIAAAEHIIASFTIELESLTQAFDDALQLLGDPQALYDTLPDGLELLLAQALFEKLWVFDEDIVSSELTAPFAELLTLEAQLAWANQSRQIKGLDETTNTDEGATCHRTRSDPLLGVMAGNWERPSVERPRGSLAIDEKNPRPP